MIFSRPVRNLLLLSLLFLSLLPAYGRAQSFTRLSFQQGQDTIASGLRFQLQEPDNAAHPQLWQGPLSIANGSSHCTADASLIRDVYLSQSGELLVVVSISGSETLLHFLTPANCARRWPGIKAFTHGVRMDGNRLTLLPACEGGGQGASYSCTAGAVYRLRDTLPPLRLASASRTLNRKELGVAFTGTRSFAHLPSAYTPERP